MSAPIWTGVSVAMQSALASAKTITAVTKANPAVATSSAHGYANGAYLTVLATGMRQINNRVFRVANQSANAHDLEGEDSTGYDTFVSGNSQLITFGNTFNTLSGISVAGGEAEMLDATTIHDTLKKLRPGMFSAIQFSFDSQWDLADAGLQAAIAASKINAERAFLFTFPDGKKMAFTGFVGASGVPTGSTGQIATTKMSITATGMPTYYNN